MDLLEIGAPEDEYHGEVESILKRLKKGQTEEEIRQIVFEEFRSWFSPKLARGAENSLRKIAKGINKFVIK